MATILYVVTRGSYSDYGIDAIFSTRELAQTFIDSFNASGDRNIEERELDPNALQIMPHKKAFFLRINKVGEVGDFEQADSSAGFGQDSSDLSNSFTHDNVWLNIHCFANDKDHAIKIANEKRLQFLASEQWVRT